MITQEYKQGQHKIKIEIAETLEDAEKNGFSNGEYSRYYVNNKLTDNYMAMMRFIIDESKKNKERLVPIGKDLLKKREEMFLRQEEAMSQQLRKLKEAYSKMGIPEKALENINDIINKLDPITNIRVAK